MAFIHAHSVSRLALRQLGFLVSIIVTMTSNACLQQPATANEIIQQCSLCDCCGETETARQINKQLREWSGYWIEI